MGSLYRPKLKGWRTRPSGQQRHKTESVYRRYAIVSDADLREATQRLLGTFPGTLGVRRVDARPVSSDNA